jgi:hypothetical protein
MFKITTILPRHTQKNDHPLLACPGEWLSSLRSNLMGYKYSMKPSEQRFTIFIIYCIYIFRTSFSRIFLYFLSLKKYLFKHQRVSTSTKGGVSTSTKRGSFAGTSHKQLSTTFPRKNGGHCLDQLINQLSNSRALFLDYLDFWYIIISLPLCCVIIKHMNLTIPKTTSPLRKATAQNA